jgi:hypothetical protein
MGQIATRLVARARLLFRLRLLLHSGRTHMGADGGADREEQRQRRQAIAFVLQIEVAVEHRIPEGVEPTGMQVHEQEGEIIEHVDIRDQAIEFDAVEQRRASGDEADVAQMQVAMAVAHLAGAPARVQQRCHAREFRLRRRDQCFHVCGVERRRDSGPQIARVARRRGGHARSAAGPLVDLGGSVEAGDLRREIEHQRARQLSALRHPVEQRVLIEAPHDHDPVDGRTRPAEHQPAVGRAHDRADFLVELWRRPPVERQLGAAGLLAQGRRRIVQVGEPHRPLQS